MLRLHHYQSFRDWLASHVLIGCDVVWQKESAMVTSVYYGTGHICRLVITVTGYVYRAVRTGSSNGIPASRSPKVNFHARFTNYPGAMGKLCTGAQLWEGGCEWCGYGVRLTTHFHLRSRLRMNGAISPLLLYAFMACICKTLPFYNLGLFYLLLLGIKVKCQRRETMFAEAVLCCCFIYALNWCHFTALSLPQATASIVEWLVSDKPGTISKETADTWSTYFHRIYSEVKRKTTKTLSHWRRCPRRDSIRTPVKYKSNILPLHQSSQ
jgi:hypothetical protein